MSKPVIIITYARSLMALTVAQSVRPIAGRLIGVDSVDWTVLGFSGLCDETRCIPDPNETPEDYVAALVALSRECREETGGPVLVMPVFEDTPLLAAHREAFADGVTIAAPSADAIAQVHPKDRLARSAEDWGVPAPKTQILTDPDAAQAPQIEDAWHHDREERREERLQVVPQEEVLLPRLADDRGGEDRVLPVAERLAAQDGEGVRLRVVAVVIPEGSLLTSLSKRSLADEGELCAGEEVMAAERVGAGLKLVTLEESSEEQLGDVLR